VDFDKLKKSLQETHGTDKISDTDVISAALYPKVFDEFYKFRSEYGPVDKLDTTTFFNGPEVANEIQVAFLFFIDNK